jgi:acyl-CoA synthetase (NDP forming)
VKAGSTATSHMLLESEAAELLAASGIEYAAHESATTAEQAADAAVRIGFPVVLKVVSPDIVHKSDVGGVVTGLADPDAVRRGFEGLMASVREHQPEARLEGALVCRQVSEGTEMIVGAVRDATFGPTVMLGAGGVLTELLGDVAFRLAPLHPDDALDTLRTLRAYKALIGYRGAPAADLDALAAVAVRLGDLMCEHPEVVEVDLNPVAALPRGSVALDARILVSDRRPAGAGPTPIGRGRTTDGECAT